MIGTTLSHFKITAKLGEGGMGEVYRAEDTKLGRDVAIKVLPQAVASDPERLARMEREARVLAALNHPNIAAIYGIEEADSHRFLVLELIEGPTLADRLGGGPLLLNEALPIFLQIGEALEAAHQKGIIHRDLKPENIKLGSDGRLRVLDFGLARSIPAASELSTTSAEETAGLTLPGTLLGTVAYMPPEQLRGSRADQRSDLFSFGVVVYQTITGTLPFGGETPVDVMGAIINKQPIPASERNADLPTGMVQILDRLLAKDPAARYSCFANVLADFSKLAEDSMMGLFREKMPLHPRAKARDKLCVCGRSTKLPLCDGNHESEDWSCAIDTSQAPLGFLASRRYQNLALKLASHYQAAVLPDEQASVETLVILVDGSDLNEVVQEARAADSNQRLVISFGVEADLLTEFLPASRFITLHDVDALHAFKAVASLLDSKQPITLPAESHGRRPSLKSAFVSHAVADEPTVLPVVEYLQHYFRTDIFTCADSIEPGSVWQESIDRALRDKDCFIYLISETSRESPFCSFEVGVAHALEKQIYAISLDGALPPVFLQHVQTIDLPRIQRRREWLDEHDLLLEEMLRILK